MDEHALSRIDDTFENLMEFLNKTFLFEDFCFIRVSRAQRERGDFPAGYEWFRSFESVPKRYNYLYIIVNRPIRWYNRGVAHPQPTFVHVVPLNFSDALGFYEALGAMVSDVFGFMGFGN